MIHLYSIQTLTLLLDPYYLPLLSHLFAHPQTKPAYTHKIIRHFGKYIAWITDWKYLSMSLISDYSHITYLHIFVYELAQSARTFLPFHSIVPIIITYIFLKDCNMSSNCYIERIYGLFIELTKSKLKDFVLTPESPR